MIHMYLTRTAESRKLLSLCLKRYQFLDYLHVSVQLIVSPTVDDWTEYNSVLIQNGTLRGKFVEMISLLKRDGYDVFVMVRESAW